MAEQASGGKHTNHHNHRTPMARMLTDRESAALHLNTARRHQRLARRYRRDGLVGTIEPLIADLEAKSASQAAKTFETQAAYDNVLAADADLDDAVRNLFNAGEQHDRSNPTTPALPTLFPDGGFGALIAEPLAQEPESVAALATRVDSLGAPHTLAAHAATLRTAAQDVRDALKAQNDAVRAQKSAEAEEEIAQAALRRQYEANYLDARRQWGRPFAERLFPRLYTGKAKDDGGDPTPENGSKPA
jgi:hypothetical protein